MDKFANVNDIRLHYLDHAAREPAHDSSVIVLLPGLSANAHSFDGLIDAGLNRHYRVLALDLRGRGLTSKPKTGYSMDDHAADVIALLDALEIEHIVLVGHSFGGLLTLYTAATFPERISRVVVIDASRQAADPSVKAAIQPSLDRLKRTLPSWQAYIDAMKAMPFYDGWWDSAIERFYRADVQINDDGTVTPRADAQAIDAAIDGVITEPWEKHLTAITQPALVLNATEPYGPPGAPPLVPADDAKATAKLLTACRYVEVPGNHMTMLFGDGAEAIVRAIEEFCE